MKKIIIALLISASFLYAQEKAIVPSSTKDTYDNMNEHTAKNYFLPLEKKSNSVIITGVLIPDGKASTRSYGVLKIEF